MFRDDKMTITRETYKLIEGEAVPNGIILIAENIPCHLSVSLQNVSENSGLPYLVTDFTLFFDSNQKFQIKENDKIKVLTSFNEVYELIAGMPKTYKLSTQVRCRLNRILES